jgi:NADH-quinone oxidoreductase subunit A
MDKTRLAGLLFAWTAGQPRPQAVREWNVIFAWANDFELANYYPIFIYLAAILGFAVTTLVLAHAIGPKHRTPVKLMPYESGMDPVGDARQRFDVKFYLIAILFLVFDVELLFLYPWAVAFYHDPAVIPADLHGPVFWEVIVFLATLAVAYVYAWRKGVFQWR